MMKYDNGVICMFCIFPPYLCSYLFETEQGSDGECVNILMWDCDFVLAHSSIQGWGSALDLGQILS